mmetsp:Transcript_38716/g.71975  ORF Transcript_38716/g.71975 Transcript_38716/m.71975 type:complete len:205 (-) Transcript_38716:111-725(-)
MVLPEWSSVGRVQSDDDVVAPKRIILSVMVVVTCGNDHAVARMDCMGIPTRFVPGFLLPEELASSCVHGHEHALIRHCVKNVVHQGWISWNFVTSTKHPKTLSCSRKLEDVPIGCCLVDRPLTIQYGGSSHNAGARSINWGRPRPIWAGRNSCRWYCRSPAGPYQVAMFADPLGHAFPGLLHLVLQHLKASICFTIQIGTVARL